MDYTKISMPSIDLTNPNVAIQKEALGYKVECFFSCRKLKDMDFIGKSDPQVILYVKEGTSTLWRKVGETEVIQDNLNPDFKKTIEAFYQFEVNQSVKIEVVDSDGGSKSELIGSVETTMGSLVGSKDFTYTANLSKAGSKATTGQVICKIVPIKQSDTEIILRLGARGLPMTTSCFCSSSIAPYYIISKRVMLAGKEEFIPIHKSEISMSNSPDPHFAQIKLKAQTVCNSDLNQIVRF